MKYSLKKSVLFVAFSVSILGLLSSCENKKHDNEDSAAVETKDEAEDKNDDKFDNKDNEKNAAFVVDAVSSSLAEIRMATLAETNGVHADVKALAVMLKKDHTALLGELKKYAEAKVISIPNEETDKADNMVDNLKDENKDFDKKWCVDMKDMHEKSIKRFEDASNDLPDAELKNIATTALPTLRTHYDKIVACHDKLK